MLQRSHDVVDALPQLGAGKPFELADKFEVLGGAHLRVERRSLRQVADAPLDLQRVLEHVEAGHGGGAIGGREKAREHAHGGGLPGAVRSEEADNLALLYLEGNVVHSGISRVSFGQTCDSNHIVLFEETRCKTREPFRV